MKWPVPAMIAATVVVIGTLLWMTRPGPAVVGVAAPAQPAPELKAEPLETAKPKRIKVYRQGMKAEFRLPAGALGNINEHVVAAARVEADDRPHTLVTTLDIETGEARAYDRPEPLPWFARDAHGEVGLSYGIKNGEPMARLSVHQNLLQIKVVRLGGLATLDADGDYYAGIGAFYRW